MSGPNPVTVVHQQQIHQYRRQDPDLKKIEKKTPKAAPNQQRHQISASQRFATPGAIQRNTPIEYKRDQANRRVRTHHDRQAPPVDVKK